MPFFDEVDYLLRNPDVRRAVRRASFRSGEQHYVAHAAPRDAPRATCCCLRARPI